MRRAVGLAAAVSLFTGTALAPAAPAQAADYVTDASEWLMQELLRLESGTRNGGIYANKPGYHNTRAQNDSGDYSVRDAEDKGGPSDKAAAYDWTFPDAQGFAPARNPDFDALPVAPFAAAAADYTAIARYSKRLMASGKDADDPRLNGWREFYGQTDNDNVVEGYDFRYDREESSDPSHLWHLHISEDRDKVTSFDNKEALLSVLRGETVEQWRNKRGAKADFDGDGASEIGLYRQSSGQWHIKSVKKNDVLHGSHQYGGMESDTPVVGDFDGDGFDDIALYRHSAGQWHIKSVKRNVVLHGSYPYGGQASDIPLAGDFDGDGADDIALYRKSSGEWHIKSVKRNVVLHGSYPYGGMDSDIPVVGDFDGDGADDIALYRKSNGQWHIKSVKKNDVLHGSHQYGGMESDLPIVGDFDGDGFDDIALYRHANGQWHIKSVKKNVVLYGSYAYGGQASDIPQVGDFDGDGVDDIALYRHSAGQWHIKSVERNVVLHGSYPYGGQASDIPVNK